MKRIVICCDGTWNTPDKVDKNDAGNAKIAGSAGEQNTGDERKKIVPVATNVVKVAEAVKPVAGDSIQQILYYDSGVGTSGNWLSRLRDGATGHGLKQNILDAYRFLTTVYEVGDELYFFGFSRGAFTVRRVAGLVRNCGILRPEALNMIDHAYGLYTSTAYSAHPAEREATLFRRTYAVEEITPIHFIGVWDTVGTRGNPLLYSRLTYWLLRNRAFHDSLLSSKVRNAHQALAIDEKRRLFSATLWKQQPHAGSQVLEQRWFAGSHCNVGGGCKESGLSNIALHWLVGKASACGLDLDLEPFPPDYDEDPEISRRGLYLIWWPLYRKIAEPGKEAFPTFEALHGTVKEKYLCNADYRPRNLEEYFCRFPDERPVVKA